MNDPVTLDFSYLANSAEFEEFSAIAYELTGLCSFLIDPTRKMTKTYTFKRESPLCRLIQSCPDGLCRCLRSDKKHFDLASKRGRSITYTCHAGLIDLAIPILSEGRHVATISSGQILPAKPTEAGFRKMHRRLRYLGLPREAMRRAYLSAPYLEKPKIHATVKLLTFFAQHLCQVAVRFRDLARQHERPAIRAAKQYVRERFREPLSLEDTARHVHLSDSYFSDLFHRSEGVSFVRYVQQQRIREACTLMETTSRKITDISLDCGFNSLTHFNRVFRKLMDCPPLRYRKRADKPAPGNAEKERQSSNRKRK